MDINVLPDNLEETFDILKVIFKESIHEIEILTEDDFIISSHFGLGRILRNSWQLWWFENHEYEEWSKTKPKLVEYFNSIGIVHADDMSAIILTSFYRHLKGLPVDVEGQVKSYHDFWKSHGYPDGIPKPKPK